MQNDSRTNVIERESEFVDPRVRHYWDEAAVTGMAWQKQLGLASVAWDVYFVFDRSVMWEKDTPKPDFWMHQLRGVDKAAFLNQKEFQTHLQMMLEKK
jgi:hypothetical protein